MRSGPAGGHADDSDRLLEAPGRIPVNLAVMPPLDPARSDAIRIRGARQNNLKNLDLDLPAQRVDRRHGRQRFGEILAGVRHPVCRGPAPLRRDVFALCAAVPGPHGPAAGRPHRGHSAGHRHRPDQSGAHLALDRRHHDGAQRSSEAAVRARRGAALPRLRPAGAARYRREHPSKRSQARSRGGRRSAAAADVSPSPSRRISAQTEIKELLAAQGYTRIHEQRGDMLQVIQDRFRSDRSSRRASAMPSKRRSRSVRGGSTCIR